MMKSTRSLVLSFGLVFVGGLAVGALGQRYYSMKSPRTETAPQRPDPGKWRERYVSEMQTRLKLTPEQMQKLGVILDEGREKFESIQKDFRSEMEGFRVGQSTKVRAILSPEQETEYDKLQKEREVRRKEMEKRRGPRPT